MLLDYINKDFDFRNFVLLDATISADDANKEKLDQALLQIYWNKRDTWPSRAAAKKDMTSNPGHRRWHPDVMDAFIVRLLHCTTT